MKGSFDSPRGRDPQVENCCPSVIRVSRSQVGTVTKLQLRSFYLPFQIRWTFLRFFINQYLSLTSTGLKSLWDGMQPILMTGWRSLLHVIGLFMNIDTSPPPSSSGRDPTGMGISFLFSSFLTSCVIAGEAEWMNEWTSVSLTISLDVCLFWDRASL